MVVNEEFLPRSSVYEVLPQWIKELDKPVIDAFVKSVSGITHQWSVDHKEAVDQEGRHVMRRQAESLSKALARALAELKQTAATHGMLEVLEGGQPMKYSTRAGEAPNYREIADLQEYIPGRLMPELEHLRRLAVRVVEKTETSRGKRFVDAIQLEYLSRLFNVAERWSCGRPLPRSRSGWVGKVAFIMAHAAAGEVMSGRTFEKRYKEWEEGKRPKVQAHSEVQLNKTQGAKPLKLEKSSKL